MLTNSVLHLTQKLATVFAAAGVITLLASGAAQADTTAHPAAPQTSSTTTVAKQATSSQAKFTLGSTRPVPANTGPRALGITSLKASGDVSTTGPGQTISGKNIAGYVNVKHNNTTVRGNIIRGRNAGKYVQNSLVRVAPGVTGTVIEFNEIYQYATIGYWQNGVGGSNFTARRNNIHDVVDMFDVDDGKATIEGNYMTAFSFQSNDADQARDSYHPYWSHNDGVQIKGGAKTTIVGNSIQMYASKRTGTRNAPKAYNYGSGITVAPGKSPVTGLLVHKNWLAGGEVGLQANFLHSGATSTNLGTISKNRVTHDQHYYPIRYKFGYQVAGGTSNYWDTKNATVPTKLRGVELSTKNGGGIKIDH